MRVTNTHGAGLLASVAVLTAAISGQARASAPDSAGSNQSADALPEIIVTAEKRETSLQQTPVAISVIGGEALATQKIASVLDLSTSLPNVNIGSGLAGSAQISIRGLGLSDILPGSEGRVAYYVDGVYISSPAAQLGSFFDVDRVEVLRGPQGTLYGRNATGGAFNVISRRPTNKFEGYINVTGGNYGLFQVDSAFGGALSDSVSARLAFQTVNRGGYGKDLFTGQDIDNAKTQSVRGSLLWQPDDRFELLLSTHYHHEDDNNYSIHYFELGLENVPLFLDSLGFPTLSNSRNLNTDQITLNKRTVYGAALKASYNLSDSLKLTGLFSYENSYFNTVNDDDGTPFQGVRTQQINQTKEYSGEIQLLGNMAKGHWVAGVFLFRTTDDPQNVAPINGIWFGGPNHLLQAAHQQSRLETNAIAAFTQLTYELTDRLSITGGLRYSYEEKKDIGDFFQFDLSRPWPPFLPLIPLPGFPFSQSASFDSFTPMATLDYKLTPEVLLYAKYSQGFKSGGFNYGQAQPNFFRPEKLTAYEAGIKSRFASGRIQANLAGFYYKYKNIQTTIILPGAGGAPDMITVSNAPAATNYGAEMELVMLPVDDLRFDVTTAFLNAKFDSYSTVDPLRPQLGLLNLSGNRLPQSPEYNLNIGGQYTWHMPLGALTPRAEYQRVGDTFFTAFNKPEDYRARSLMQPAYTMGNAFLTFDLKDKPLTATAYIRNMTNKVTRAGLFNQAPFLGSQVVGYIGPPRTYGVTIGYKF